MSLLSSFKFFVKSISNIHRQGDKPNILLVATPRGGSTWVMEIIASQPGMKYYDEPFSVRRENVQKTKLFKSWEDFQPEQHNEQKIIQYLNDLQTNKYGVMNPPPFRKGYRFFTNRIVFKIHELEHFINNIEHTCSLKVLYLLRHPIPTSLSRTITPRLELFVSSEFYRQHYLDQQQHKESQQIWRHGTDLEKKILDWCFENLVPLRFADRSQWVTITYEELLLNSRKMCELLASEMALDDIDAMLKTINKPAANITLSNKDTLKILQSSDEEKRKLDLVTKWKGKISSEEEHSCMNILNIFQLDTYVAGRYIATDSLLHFDDTTNKLTTLSN